MSSAMEKLHQRLFEAVSQRQDDTVSQLLEQGADPLWKIEKSGQKTALDLALQLRSRKLSSLLISHSLSTASRDASTLHSITDSMLARLFPGEADTPEQPDAAQDRQEIAPSLELKRDSDFAKVERAVAAIRAGEFVVVLDDEDRENEGDLIIAAEKMTEEKMAFMVNYTSGIVCVGVEGRRLDQLRLPQMVQQNTEAHGTAFTHSVDYKHGTSTGISASDRAKTIRALTDATAKPDDFTRPGHVFPLRAKDGGVLVRQGHTEASVDLARMAGLFPAGAMCEIVASDGSMARAPALHDFARQHGLAVVTIEQMMAYRKAKPSPADVLFPPATTSASSPAM